MLSARFVRFVVIGGVGFVIEASIITLVGHLLGWDAIDARMLSFPCAVMATWWLNRKYNFRSRNRLLVEGSSYFVVQVAGALSNLAMFAWCISISPFFAAWPVVGLAVGAVAGLLVNFFLSNYFVFRQSKA